MNARMPVNPLPALSCTRAQTSALDYYFERLPIHSGPGTGDSLSTFLGKLASENGYSNMAEFLCLSFGQSVRDDTIPSLDLCAPGLAHLADLARQPVESLAGLTGTYTTYAFSFLADRGDIRRFLRSSVSKWQRYCPACFAHKPEFMLIWRFVELKGCPEHACRLLDRCTRCQTRIPFFGNLRDRRRCVNCKADLAAGPTTALNEPESHAARECGADLRFLLYPPQSSLEGEPYWKSLHSRLRAGRERTGFPRSVISRVTALADGHIGQMEALERPATASLLSYQIYARFLGLCLRSNTMS